MAIKYTYTDSDVKEITEKYAQGITLEVLAEQYTKSVASVRMKLVKLGVYKKVVSTGSAVTKSENLEIYNKCVADVGYAEI